MLVMETRIHNIEDALVQKGVDIDRLHESITSIRGDAREIKGILKTMEKKSEAAEVLKMLLEKKPLRVIVATFAIILLAFFAINANRILDIIEKMVLK